VKIPTKKAFRHGRLLVQLDKSQVFPDDPGQGTPAMIRCFEYHATYWCGVDNGLYDSEDNQLDLTPEEIDWLQSIEPTIIEFLYPRPPAEIKEPTP